MILHGNCLDVLKTLPEASVHMAVTSPPYWSLRDYGVPPSIWGGDASCDHEWGGVERGKRADMLPSGTSTSKSRIGRDARQGFGPAHCGHFCLNCGGWLGCLGLEPTPELYVQHIADIFDEVRRVLRDDGTLWLNLADSYAAGKPRDLNAGGLRFSNSQSFRRDRRPLGGAKYLSAPGLKPKDLVGIPWMVAFELRARGWYLRGDIIWAKSNPMPESIKDRPTKSHEYVFLLAKSEEYFYDAEAIREPHKAVSVARVKRARHGGKHLDSVGGQPRRNPHSLTTNLSHGLHPAGRNRRSVWTIPTAPFPGAHFATFPPRLVEPCILAGTSAHGCCPRCGASFERMVRRGGELREQKLLGGCNADGDYHGSAQKSYQGTGAQDPSAVKKRILEGMRERITVGWRPTCGCGGLRIRPTAHNRRLERAWYRQRWQARIDARWTSLFGQVRPCTVLDPFGGSGTTRRVANSLGREAILIELNPEYIKLAAPAEATA